MVRIWRERGQRKKVARGRAVTGGAEMAQRDEEQILLDMQGKAKL